MGHLRPRMAIVRNGKAIGDVPDEESTIWVMTIDGPFQGEFYQKDEDGGAVVMTESKILIDWADVHVWYLPEKIEASPF